jgi:two-component sensor histidine kinase
MELQNSFQIYDRVSCDLEIKNIVLSIEKAVPCGLIINELVSNALTHAFPDNRIGKVTISLIETDKNHFELIVQDNGIGITNDLKTLEKKSLGIRIVGLLTDQIDGTFEMESKKGSKFTVRFKVENE